MANTKTLSHGNIKVTFDDAGLDVTSEAVPTPPTSVTFTIIKVLGNIFFFKQNTDYKQRANQKASFKKPVTLEVPITVDVETHPLVLQKGLDTLELVYFDKTKGDWVAFKNQSINVAAKVGKAQFTDWIKDPPVGWGSPG